MSQLAPGDGVDNGTNVEFKAILISLDFLFRFASRQNEYKQQ